MANTKQQLQREIKSISCDVVPHQQIRRSANYKPNIWCYDFIQSLTSEFTNINHKERVEKLKKEFLDYLSGVPELSKPLVVETIRKLGLSNVLHKEIKDTLISLNFNLKMNSGFEDDILRSTALGFRLLRQHGYNVSQDTVVEFIGEKGLLKETKGSKLDFRGVLELYEASYLALDGEDVLAKAKIFSFQYLVNNFLNMEPNLAKQVTYASQIPCHWKVLWFDVAQQIHGYELEDDKNMILLELAKLNFNIVQSMHLDDLKETSRWWKNLGLMESIGFTRDRLVECFLWTVGVACEPQHAILRKCLTKVVAFILVLDDAYDIYGFWDELECLTKIIERWDDNEEEIEQLPDCLKICFKALVTTCNEIANVIQKERGLNYNDTLSFLKVAWADFCKALLKEAYWYNQSCVPSLEDYLKSAWITSSGPLLSLIAFLCTTDNGNSSDELKDKWEEAQHLIYYASLIIRLLNDQGTSTAEFERGEAYSSILCYMREAKVTEEKAREHIKEMIQSAWSKINMVLLSTPIEKHTFVNLVINTARVCHFIYQKGDGFSVQDGDTKNKIKRLLIQPLQL